MSRPPSSCRRHPALVAKKTGCAAAAPPRSSSPSHAARTLPPPRRPPPAWPLPALLPVARPPGRRLLPVARRPDAASSPPRSPSSPASGLVESATCACSHLRPHPDLHRAAPMVVTVAKAGPEAYSNPMIHNHLQTYTKMGKEKYGQDWDPAMQPLDGEIVVRMGQGKKHGRYAIGDNTIDTASTPNLATIRAGRANPDIRQRSTASQFGMEMLQVRLDEERRKREALEARLERTEEVDRARQAHMEQWYNWVNGFAQRMGQAPPPPFAPPSPFTPSAPTFSPPVAGSAAASNDAPNEPNNAPTHEDPSARIGRALFRSSPPPTQ